MPLLAALSDSPLTMQRDPRKLERLHLLLVGQHGTSTEALEAALKKEDALWRVAPVETFEEAKLALREGRYDLILTHYRLPDGDALDLISFTRAFSFDVPVIIMTDMGGEDLAVTAMKGGAYDCVRVEKDGSHLTTLPVRVQEARRRHRIEQQLRDMKEQEDQLKHLQTIRTTVATVNHEINNPLAIISGNAQLLLEMTKVMDVDPDLVKPIRDIEEASRRIAEAIKKLSNLKEVITRPYVSGEDNLLDLS